MSLDNISNNRQITKNTIALYFRTFITMIVGLYTSRVLLQALGFENYGINNVVGGIVSMSTIISATMSQAISRYLTHSLGKGDEKQLSIVFSTSVCVQFVIALIVCLALETFGVWFLNYGANIPQNRMIAANWVLQCSIISTFISLISSPYTALLVSHERLGIYAYTSISEAALKLMITLSIMHYSGDRLILLSILCVVSSVFMITFYRWYSGKHFSEAHFQLSKFDKRLLKEIAKFSGWNMLNCTSWVFGTHGLNMLINVYFGVVFNAARGIATSVNNMIRSFVNNFITAFTPQITKLYAAGEISKSITLSNKATKFTWMMMLIFIVPVFFEADTLLHLWLGDVPEYASLLLRFAMFESLVHSSGSNLFTLLLADGRVKSYNMKASLIEGLIFPSAWLAYIIGAPIWACNLCFIAIFIMIYILYFYELRKIMDFSISEHLKTVVRPCMILSILSFILPYVYTKCLDQSYFRFFTSIVISVLWTLMLCYTIGLDKGEKEVIKSKTQLLLKKI